MRITPRLTLLFIFYAALLLVGVLPLAYHSGREALRQAAITELLATSVEKQAAFSEWVMHKQAGIAAAADAPAVIAAAAALSAAPPASSEARAAHDGLVAELLPRLHEFEALFYMEASSGQVLAATEASEEGMFREDRDFFIQGQAGPFVQQLYYSVSLQQPTMMAAAPLHAADGRLVGVLAGRLDLEEMNAIINRRAGLRQTDEAFLVNRSNLIVTQPRLIADPAVLRRGLHTEAVDLCLAGSSGEIETLDYRRVPAIVVYRWMPEHNLCLIVKLDQMEAYAPTRAFGLSMALLSALALLAAVPVAAVLSHSLVRPILALQRSAARFGQGDLAARLPDTARDELGDLARAFNHMAAALAEQAQQLRAHSSLLEARVAERTAALAESEARYRLMTENIADVVWVLDLAAQRFAYVSPSVERLRGYTAEEVMAQPVDQALTPQARDRLSALTAARTAQFWASAPASLSFVDEVDQPCKDGAIVQTEVTTTYLLNAYGQLEIIGVSRDISARKRVEQALQVAHARLRQFVDANIIGVIVAQADGTVIEANDYYLNLLGFSRQEFEQGLVDWRAVTPPEWRPADEKALGELRARGVCEPYEKEYLRRDGVRVPVLLADALLTGASEEIAAFAVDLTALKQAEYALARYAEELRRVNADLERSNKELEQFAYVASHDLQEPLRMVSSYTQLLARRYAGQLDQDAQEFIHYAVDGANRMQRLIQDLLTFSRVATRAGALKPVDLHLALHEAIANLSTAIAETGAEVISTALPTVRADRTQMVQVFQNLIGNALKFRQPDRAPRVLVSADFKAALSPVETGKNHATLPSGASAEMSGEWVIAVKDNGIGIAPKYFERIFLIFQRLHGPQDYPGTGIGLALCQRIIDRHGGRIWVESSPGQGATFFFSLKS